MGADLYSREGAARAQFSQPAVSTGYQRIGTEGIGGPTWYNETAAPPVKYSVPSAQKEYLQRKQAIRENIPKTDGVVRFDPVTDTEVEYLKTMEEQAELADFDRYVQTLINPRKPGNMKFLMEIYPQFVERRIKQAHTDYSYAIRKQTIDQWGVNTFDDLHFLYLMDQGKVAGPMLTTPGRDVANKYQAGWLAPGAYRRDRESGIRLPFASAKFGEGAGRQADGTLLESPNGWTMPDDGQALAGGRGQAQMAASMYQQNPQNMAGPNAPPGTRRSEANILSRL
jgi:hypothetical protein